MPLKPFSGGSGYTLDPIRELASSGTEFNYRAEYVIRVERADPADLRDIDDATADRIAEALERRRRKRNS